MLNGELLINHIRKHEFYIDILEEAHCVSFANINQLRFSSKTKAVYCYNRMKHKTIRIT
jgi:hypothetical protein